MFSSSLSSMVIRALVNSMSVEAPSVAEAQARDANRRIVCIDSRVMRELSLTSGDVIYITGARKNDSLGRIPLLGASLCFSLVGGIASKEISPSAGFPTLPSEYLHALIVADIVESLLKQLCQLVAVVGHLNFILSMTHTHSHLQLCWFPNSSRAIGSDELLE